MSNHNTHIIRTTHSLPALYVENGTYLIVGTDDHGQRGWVGSAHYSGGWDGVGEMTFCIVGGSDIRVPAQTIVRILA